MTWRGWVPLPIYDGDTDEELARRGRLVLERMAPAGVTLQVQVARQAVDIESDDGVVIRAGTMAAVIGEEVPS